MPDRMGTLQSNTIRICLLVHLILIQYSGKTRWNMNYIIEMNLVAKIQSTLMHNKVCEVTVDVHRNIFLEVVDFLKYQNTKLPGSLP